MMLSVDISHQFPGFSLQARMNIGPGVTAIFGRSGSGKTTIVNAIAGLWVPQNGKISLDGTPLLDTQAGLNVAPHKRRMGYVFQDGRLFPHLSVMQNLRFGARYAPTPAGPGDEERVINLLGLADLLERRPANLSGGEKQRVALGRALLSQPQILLMDEPLAALDAPLKQDILPYLERLQAEAGIPILYVSHSVDEIARLADQLVLLEKGQVQALGPVFDVLANPEMVPMIGVQEAGAVINATVVAHHEDGISTLQTSAGMLELPGVSAAIGATLRLRVRAQDVILSRSRPDGLSSVNILPVTVQSLRSGDGPGTAVALLSGQDKLLARITTRAAKDMELSEGQLCYAVVKATAVARGSIGSAR